MDDSAKGGVQAKQYMMDPEKEVPLAPEVGVKAAGNAVYGGLQEPTGNWLEAAFHFLTQVSTFPNLLGPYIFASLGWGGASSSLVIVTTTIIYCTFIMADLDVIDGVRYNRYRDLAAAVWGEKIGRPLLGALNIMLTVGVLIGSILSGGQLLKALVLLYSPDTSISLGVFITIVGAVVLMAGLVPTLHDVKWVNGLGNLLVFMFCTITGALCITAGVRDESPKDYSVVWGSSANHFFQIFNTLALMASITVAPMIPETQACLKNPVRDMKKGMMLGWPTVLYEMLWIAIPGYYAFGNLSQVYILQSFTEHRGPVATALAMAVLNICVMSNCYAQPLYEIIEQHTSDTSKGVFHPRNLIPRTICRWFAVAVFTMFAAMLPFFSYIQSLLSSLTFIPMCIVLPLLLHQSVKKTSGPRAWLHYLLVVCFSIIAIGGTVGSIRGIILSANTFQVFANI